MPIDPETATAATSYGMKGTGPIKYTQALMNRIICQHKQLPNKQCQLKNCGEDQIKESASRF